MSERALCVVEIRAKSFSHTQSSLTNPDCATPLSTPPTPALPPTMGELWIDGVAQFMAGDVFHARANSFAEEHAHLFADFDVVQVDRTMYTHEQWNAFVAWRSMVEEQLAEVVCMLGGSLSCLQAHLAEQAALPPSGPKEARLRAFQRCLAHFEHFEHFGTHMCERYEEISSDEYQLQALACREAARLCVPGACFLVEVEIPTAPLLFVLAPKLPAVGAVQRVGAVLAGFERDTSGAAGAVELCGLLAKGDTLVKVAGQVVAGIPLLEISQLIAAARFPLTLTFERAVSDAESSGELGAAATRLSGTTVAHDRQEEEHLREAMQLSRAMQHSAASSEWQSHWAMQIQTASSLVMAKLEPAAPERSLLPWANAVLEFNDLAVEQARQQRECRLGDEGLPARSDDLAARMTALEKVLLDEKAVVDDFVQKRAEELGTAGTEEAEGDVQGDAAQSTGASWCQVSEPGQQTYYWNSETQKSSWLPPEGFWREDCWWTLDDWLAYADGRREEQRGGVNEVQKTKLDTCAEAKQAKAESDLIAEAQPKSAQPDEVHCVPRESRGEAARELSARSKPEADTGMKLAQEHEQQLVTLRLEEAKSERARKEAQSEKKNQRKEAKEAKELRAQAKHVVARDEEPRTTLAPAPAAATVTTTTLATAVAHAPALAPVRAPTALTPLRALERAPSLEPPSSLTRRCSVAPATRAPPSVRTSAEHTLSLASLAFIANVGRTVDTNARTLTVSAPPLSVRRISLAPQAATRTIVSDSESNSDNEDIDGATDLISHV